MPSITSVNHTLGNGKRLVTQNEVTSEDITTNQVRSSSKQSNNGLSRATSFAAKAIASMAFLLPLVEASPAFAGGPGVAPAANIAEREKAVVAFAENSWKDIKTAMDGGKKLGDVPFIDSKWNNIQAVFMVADDTMIESLEPIRMQILKEGATNPDIPPRVIHTALYTGAVLSN